jgi:hypothetical protein
MSKLSIGIIDLVANCYTNAFWARVMNANFASIMPQVIAAWCSQNGYDVSYVCYTGRENLLEELPKNVNLVFISSFTQGAELAYALSNLFRSRGAVTVLGGPHARCYPQDAQKYFDYVLGFTDKELVLEVLRDCSPHRPTGLHLSAKGHPTTLPGIKERWKFIDLTLRKSPFFKIVPLIASFGCPYSCSFCIDSTLPYQPLDIEMTKEDLSFLLGKFKRPHIAWHDPSFGVRFNYFMDAIEEVVPPDRIDFIAESPLSILSEPHLQRLQRNGFKFILPGIESWNDLGRKSGTSKMAGIDKVRQISEHANLVLRYVPYIQTNFVIGLDADAGPEPFQLTKRFLDLVPGAFPGYSLFTAFGQAAPANLDYQRVNRILPFPFQFQNNNEAMNIRPLNYSWPEFYDHVIDLTKYSFSWKMIRRRFASNESASSRWINLLRGISTEGFGRIRYFKEIRRRLDSDPPFRRFFEQETTEIPEFFVNRVRQQLGPFWTWLPEGALQHDPNAYLAAHNAELDKS